MDTEPILVEDLALLLLDEAGGYIAGATTLHYTLGGALLADLALRGRIEVDDTHAVMGGPRVHAADGDPVTDPLLADTLARVTKKTQSAQNHLVTLGSGLWVRVVDRLVERGYVRRETKRLLRVFRWTVTPAADGSREAEVRRRIVAVLEDGADPDPRTGALIALLSGSQTLPVLRPPLPWNTAAATRAKELEQGSWGASAVSTVVARTVSGIATSTAVGAGLVIATAMD
ncbi:MAG TPA: GPP34 family phosphoprotein [Nocardioides sp.]